ncbi:MAG TPA: exodeoxyribonuclease VII small subunit [Phycisphaerae bacterium]|nr:exodeoxyribonuclease VII small subunit [Phycisphaerae bacterium]
MSVSSGPPTFEQSMLRLEAIVEAIEQGKIGLEDSLKQFEEGMALIKHCRTVLSDAEMKIQHLQATGDGGAVAGPPPG